MNKNIYSKYNNLSNKTTYTAEDIIKLLELKEMCDTISLNTPIRNAEEADTEIGDLIESDLPSPQSVIEHEENNELLLEIMYEVLSPRETKVLMMRYGFDNGEPKTLETVGEYFSVTRERIRQIEYRALQKLKWYIKVKMEMKSEDF